MTVLLAIDASLRIPNCAVDTGKGIFFATGSGLPTESLTEAIEQCLGVAEVDVSEVGAIIACVGPGSYMGVRSAVATANALGLALNIEVDGALGVDALVVSSAKRASWVAVPAGRGRWYAANYEWHEGKPRRVGGPFLVDDPPQGALRGVEPNANAGVEGVLDARGLLKVAQESPHLMVEKASSLTPHLQAEYRRNLGG